MTLSSLLIIIFAASAVAYFLGHTRSQQIAKPAGGIRSLAALPSYYATMVGLWALIPSLLLVFLWLALDGSIIASLVKSSLPAEAKQLSPESLGLVLSQVENVASGIGSVESIGIEYRPAIERLQNLNAISAKAMPILSLCALAVGLLLGLRAVRADNNARYSVEKVFNATLFICSSIAIFTTFGIVFSVLFESIAFFQKVPITEFLFGTHWSPQIAIRADQAGASGSFGVIPLIVGTLLISFIALLIAVPIGLMSAIYLSEYASRRVRGFVKPTLEILAGVPTVVYGFFAALTVAPAIRQYGDAARDWGAENGIDWLANLAVSSESALAAGIVMGVMIIPFVSSLSDDVINAVPQSLRDGSFGLGATQSETIKRVIFPAALPGIVGGVLLAASRAIGETMIVVMAAGLAANLTVNPLEAVTTVTVQIVTLLVGDQEFDSAKTLAAFALGLFLFLITLFLNVIALRVVKKYREQYD
ncbi:phosphate ABC transporter permease subunit PstC [Arenicella xantha]|uniref:Phosphate transport system permease protein n=1 Tax=Arenicella xantha TaxID=644221 RepID=A0A395JJE7_9GAMM|nr:phosphate ABC transporter permease subunit PstC [Arenicella xantha]RBP50906.1 phosphate ABC transporter membrane protein 1 (PhoT family) [Arenicella xantha]